MQYPIHRYGVFFYPSRTNLQPITYSHKLNNVG
ncbi:hypothetical protein VPHK389_0108 [Vibrio phage K389]